MDNVHQERERFNICLDYVRARAAGELEGLYGPRSVAWRMYREPGVLLGGMRALLLQIAHPAVAEGVERYSGFRQDAAGRLHRTLSITYQMVFGTLEDSIEAATMLHRRHSRVQGTVPATSKSHWAGGSFRANQTELLLWVHATLVDTGLRSYELIYGPLSADARDQYYDESRLGAALMGIPPDFYPPDMGAFYLYLNAMFEEGTLAVGEAGRSQAAALLSSPYSLSPLVGVVTTGLLPASVRRAFDLPWGEREQRAFRRRVALARTLARLLPGEMRAVPPYHRAQIRLAQANGHRASRISRVIARATG